MQVGVCAALRLCAPTWGISLKDLLDSKSFKLEAVPQSVSASFIPSPFSAFNKCVAFVKTPRVPCACALRQGSKYEAHFLQHRSQSEIRVRASQLLSFSRYPDVNRTTQTPIFFHAGHFLRTDPCRVSRQTAQHHPKT